MINKTLSLYDKARTVELECFDGNVKDSNATKKYLDNEWNICEIKRNQEEIRDEKEQKEKLKNKIVIAGNCYQMYFMYYDDINDCFVTNIDTT